jgi:CubicO group peptidase (beta-lactamase class C family)
VLREDVERGRISGAVILVARKGTVAYPEAVGYRDRAAGTPTTTDAIFRRASMTKPIVTVAALSLVEDGRLLLSDPVSHAWIAQPLPVHHLGASISRGSNYSAGPGYTSGLGVSVREESGRAPIPASAGDYVWPGAFAAYWWADPTEELVAASLLQAPFGRHDNQLVRHLVLQAIVQ